MVFAEQYTEGCKAQSKRQKYCKQPCKEHKSHEHYCSLLPENRAKISRQQHGYAAGCKQCGHSGNKGGYKRGHYQHIFHSMPSCNLIYLRNKLVVPYSHLWIVQCIADNPLLVEYKIGMAPIRALVHLGCKR